MPYCALCNARLTVEAGRVKCWLGNDCQYHCCREHADFAVNKALVVLGPFVHLTL
jgi:hypothetical protein